MSVDHKTDADRGTAGDTASPTPHPGPTPSTPTLQQLRDFAGVSVWSWDSINDQVFHSAGGDVRTALEQGLPLRTVLQHLAAEDRARVRRALRAGIRQHRSGSVRFSALDGRGGSRMLQATFFPHEADTPSGWLQIIVQDITRAARAERALRESEDNYRTAVALNPQIPWLADADGNITEFGPRWTEIVGFTRRQTLGQGWVAALHPDDLPDVWQKWSAALQSGTPIDVEYRVRDRHGVYIWMRARAACRRNPDGTIQRWYGTLEDIDDRRRAEAALRDSEEFARSILESGVVATEVLDLDGRLIFMNGPGMQMMEVDDFEAIRGRPFDDFWPPEVAGIVRAGIEGAKAGHSVRNTLFGPTAKWSPRWWDLTISPVLDARGNVSRILALSHDVTDAVRNEAEARASADQLASVLEGTMDCVISTDREWRITYMNRHAVDAFPILSGKLGEDLRLQFGAEGEPFFALYGKAMAERLHIAFEEYLPSARAWFEIQAFGSLSGLNIFFRNVTERREAQERVAHMARHDPLTGLANRAHFHDGVRDALARRSEGGLLAVMVVDLDDFKLVNDTLGHPAGDALLREVATRLRVCAGSGGAVARLGGDEFAVMIPVGRSETAATVAQAILGSILQPYVFNEESVSVGASIGIAMAPRDGLDAETLLQHADIALYRVKAEHGGSFRFFEAVMDRAQRDRRALKRDLLLALRRGEISLAYQPQVDLRTLAIRGFEALLRWYHPQRGQVPPSVFIPLAEESGLIGDLGEFALETAAREALYWPQELRVSVNLSPNQFRVPGLSGRIADTLARVGLPPGRLEIEITESVLLDDNASALAELGLMQGTGIRVALDDFGTGYSSLGYLRRFSFDRLKIDRSFVSDLPGSDGSLAIVRSILGLGRSFGTQITAEGVETEAQLALLLAENCEEAQGYLFSRPVSAREARLLAQRGRLDPAQAAQKDMPLDRTGTHS